MEVWALPESKGSSFFKHGWGLPCKTNKIKKCFGGKHQPQLFDSSTLTARLQGVGGGLEETTLA